MDQKFITGKADFPKRTNSSVKAKKYLTNARDRKFCSVNWSKSHEISPYKEENI